MKFYHLSHTDLDGYGCQFVSRQFMKDPVFYNANYGIEVKNSLKAIFDDIVKIDDNIFILISDINLSYDESKKLDNDVKQMLSEGRNIKLVLLDHHISGQKSADRFDWYYLDSLRSATKIVYDYFLDDYKEIKIKCNYLQDLVAMVDAIDLWHMDDTYNFEFGKVCMSMIYKANEINNILFPNENRNFKFFLLENAMQYYHQQDGYIMLDEAMYGIKKQYLDNNKNDTLDNLAAIKLVELLGSNKEQFSVLYGDHKGLLTYQLGNISIPANAFLEANDDYSFFINISKYGSLSIRANDKLDVAKLANDLCGGGGHRNASGGKFDKYPRTNHTYQDVYKFIQDKLDDI